MILAAREVQRLRLLFSVKKTEVRAGCERVTHPAWLLVVEGSKGHPVVTKKLEGLSGYQVTPSGERKCCRLKEISHGT